MPADNAIRGQARRPTTKKRRCPSVPCLETGRDFNSFVALLQFARAIREPILTAVGSSNAPGVVAVSRWRDPVAAQYLADRTRGHAVSQPLQLALDPHRAPGAVLPSRDEDQSDEFVADQRPARRLRLTPLVRDQTPVPTARSVQASLGFGITRRNTATFCAKSVSRRSSTPANGATTPARTGGSRRSGKADRRPQSPIMPRDQPRSGLSAEFLTRTGVHSVSTSTVATAAPGEAASGTSARLFPPLIAISGLRAATPATAHSVRVDFGCHPVRSFTWD